ncbi:MAG: ATP-grasp domain-containing protein [Firmicutes bacterium]|nr:ATP-grasp domain-containing protein [Bacillota bacterium]
MDKILIMGAGIYQVPLIQTAKRLGLYTIVASIPGNYPGFDLADQVYYINTTDQEAILEAARKEQITGICTAGTDVAVATIGYVNQEMGLAGVSRRAGAATSDKTMMQDLFKAGGVASAKHIRAGSIEEVRRGAEEIGLPVVIKCVDSSGSRGISIVEREEELETAFAAALKHSRRDYCLVEQKLPGEEIGIDGIVQDGKLVFLAPHRKCVYRSGDTVITAGHDFPFTGSEQLLREIRRQTELAVAALGLDNCAVNLDAFVDGDRMYVIEIGGRSGATCIPELISMHYGFDYYEEILRLALGQPVRVRTPKAPVPCRARLIMCPAAGTITSVDLPQIRRMREDGIQIGLDYGAGTEVEAMHNGTDRIGQVIAAVDHEEQMERIMEKVHHCIRLDGKPLDELWRAAGQK